MSLEYIKSVWNMKKHIVNLICVLCSLMTTAQTQQGYVKTKGRLGSNGTVIAGTRLQGATVSVKGGNSVVSGNNGTFSLSVPTNSYYLQNVQKQGYVLTDPDVLSKQYAYSKNPLVLVLEDKEQQKADMRAIERKISSNLYSQLQKRSDELEALKEKNKITEEKYRDLLQKLNRDQDENEKLISEMADRYSKMDFDEVDEFNRRISSLILEGRLTEADSLLNTKGDINTRAATLRQHQEANAQAEQELKKKQKKLEKSKALTQKELEDLAQDCYTKFEIFKMQHENDSAAYYIELRARLDTAVITWQCDAGAYIKDYIADYSKSHVYYLRALRLSILMYGEQNEITASSYNNVGSIYDVRGDYSKALDYYLHSLSIREKMKSDRDSAIAVSYNNVGGIYYYLGNYDKAIEFFQKCLEVEMKIYGEEHRYVANDYNNIGEVYQAKRELDKAMECHKKALAIRKKVLPEEHQEVAHSYNNIGTLYQYDKKYDQSLEYHEKALAIRLAVFGPSHPDVALSYNNIGMVYLKLNSFPEALNNLRKALDIDEKVLGKEHATVATVYDNIGNVYRAMGDSEKSLEAAAKALRIRENIFGTNNASVAISYYNLGSLYASSDKEKALILFVKAQTIWKGIFEENHPYLKRVSEMITQLKKQE